MATNRGGGGNFPINDPRAIAPAHLVPGSVQQRNQGNVGPQFVNIAAAHPTRPAFAHMGSSGSIRAVSGSASMRMISPAAVQEGLHGQPALQTMPSNPPFAHAHGAINLTITNGAVNLRPGGPGLSLRPENVSQAQAVIKANITGPGSLQRIPTILQQNVSQPQAINLKLQNPINLRLTGPQANLIHAAGRSGATIIGQRPAMLINASQLSAIRPMHGQGQVPLVQGVNHSGGQFIAQGSLTVLPQGAKISTNIPLTQLQMGGKIPLRALHPGSIRHAAAINSGVIPSAHQQVPQRNMPAIIQRSGNQNAARSSPVKSSAAVLTSVTISQQAMNMAAMAHQRPPASHPQLLISAAPEVMKGKQHSITSTANKLMPVSNRTILSVPGAHEQLEATDLSNKSPSKSPIKTTDASGSDKADVKSEETKEESMIAENDGDKIKAEESGRITSEKRKSSVKSLSSLDIESSLEWKNGIGTLIGSDTKFRKNELGMLEIVEDDLQCSETLDDVEMTSSQENTASSRSSPGPNKDTISGISPAKSAGEVEVQLTDGGGFISCKNCGIYAPPDELLPGGKFCSRNCLARHAAKSSKKRADSTVAAPGSAKKKKRKISDNETDEGALKDAKIKKEDVSMASSGLDLSTTSTSEAHKDEDVAVNLKTKTTVSSGGKRGKSFSWSTYLSKEGATAAPSSCFKEYQGIPESRNSFRVGMRLEAIDPRHPSHYCVVHVVEIRGYRLRLRFDGYSESYDFWVNADSPFIFYVGWSEKNGKYLDPPKEYLTKAQTLDWSDYLRENRYAAAPKSLFQTTSSTSVTPHGFRTGMKLEAVDKKNSSLICVASVSDVLGDHILIHFDGWEDVYDYWCDPGSPYIHPVGWCQTNGVPLSPPKDWKPVETFTWAEYLRVENTVQVPPRAFKPRQPNSFEEGMHMEVVDKRNPVLIRAASIVQVEAYSIKIHFSGWSQSYDYWLDDDSPDIHPCGWCAKTGHLLTPPLTQRDLAEKTEGCPTPGCTGVGHVKGAKYTGHHSAFGCPYSNFNMNKDNTLLDRLSPGRPEFENGYTKRATIKEEPDDWTASAAARKSKSPPEERMKMVSPPAFTSNDIMRNATPSQMEKARELLEQQQKRGIPLFGKGSGRGRKKTIVRLMKVLQDSTLPTVRPTPQQTVAQLLDQKERNLQHSVHQSVFSPPGPALHPYHDLPLGWSEHSNKLLSNVADLSAEEVRHWNVTRVVDFIASLTEDEQIGRAFEDQQIDGEALMLLNQADMVRSLEMKLGPALKIHNSILMLKNNVKV